MYFLEEFVTKKQETIHGVDDYGVVYYVFPIGASYKLTYSPHLVDMYSQLHEDGLLRFYNSTSSKSISMDLHSRGLRPDLDMGEEYSHRSIGDNLELQKEQAAKKISRSIRRPCRRVKFD